MKAIQTNAIPTNEITTTEFPPATRDQWLAAVEAVLKGKPFEKTLVGRTADGVRIEPLYPRAAGAVPLAGRAPGAPWAIGQRVDMPDASAANDQALADLEGGASGLAVILQGAPRARFGGLPLEGLAHALDGVMLDLIDLRVETAPFAGRAAAEALASHIAARKIDPTKLALDFGLDPIGDAAATGAAAAAVQTLPNVGAIAKNLAAHGFASARFARADGRAIHDAGGTEAQELGFVLASAVAYLRSLEAAGLDLDDARRRVTLFLSADADQFLTMAKTRALRHLWARVEEASGLAPEPVFIGAETAWRMMGAVDPAVNWLRTTLAVFAAGVGGANAVTALPWTLAIGLPDAFARRVSRNLQSILIEEVNLCRVADPVAGAGGVEALTSSLAEAGWAFFQTIEKAGGAVKALETGLIQNAVAEARTAREKAVATRRASLVGVSEFPNLTEIAPEVLAIEAVSAPPPGLLSLPAIRLAEPFEALRNAAKAAPVVAKVHLAPLGSVAVYSARAAFAKNLFEAGGLVTPLPEGGGDAATIDGDFRASGARIACLVSSDEFYGTLGPAAARLLKDAGAAQVWLAGRPGDDEAALRAAGVDGFIHVGCDVLDCLRTAHRALA